MLKRCSPHNRCIPRLGRINRSIQFGIELFQLPLLHFVRALSIRAKCGATQADINVRLTIDISTCKLNLVNARYATCKVITAEIVQCTCIHYPTACNGINLTPTWTEIDLFYCAFHTHTHCKIIYCVGEYFNFK